MPSVDKREALRGLVGLAGLLVLPTPDNAPSFSPTPTHAPEKEQRPDTIVQITNADCYQNNISLASNNEGKIYAAALQLFQSPNSQDAEVWEYDPKYPDRKSVPTNFPPAGPGFRRESLTLSTSARGQISAITNTSHVNIHGNLEIGAEGFLFENGKWKRQWSWAQSGALFQPFSSRAHTALLRYDGAWIVMMEDNFYDRFRNPPGQYTYRNLLLLRDGLLERSTSIDSPTGYTMFPTMAEGNGHILSVHTAARNPVEKRSLTLQTFSTNDLSRESGLTEVIVTNNGKQIDVVMAKMAYNKRDKFDIAIAGIDENKRFVVLSISVPQVTQEEKITISAQPLSNPATENADKPEITHANGQTFVAFHSNTDNLERVVLVSLSPFQRHEIPGSGALLNNHRICPRSPARLTDRFLKPMDAVYITGDGQPESSPYNQIHGYRPPLSIHL